MSQRQLLRAGLGGHRQGDSNPDFLGVFDLFWECGYDAYSVSDQPEVIELADVAAYVENGDPRPWVTGNYLFRQRSGRCPSGRVA